MRRVQALILAAVALVGVAARPAPADDRVIINADTKARRGLYPIAVPAPVGGDPALAKLVTGVQSFDLAVSSWFKVLDPRSFLADLKAEGMSIDPRRWKDVGAFGVIKASVARAGDRVVLQFKLYELDKGAVPVLEREYSGSVADARQLTHFWCNEVVRYYTGEPGFFGSRIVFSTAGRKGRAVLIMDFDGANVRSLTHNRSINILPAFAPTGLLVAFTSFMRGNPDLYITGPMGGLPRRIARYPGMNTGASFSPDGSRIAVTLSRDGNAEIYVLRASDGKILKRLTNNRYIDTSPAWSPDGKQIAFVSDREGGPQIFVMGADGSNQRRVSTVGNFNQTPAWSPRKDARVLAYTARDDASGRFDIVTLDLESGKMVRITQGQGNNEEPTFAPGGRVLAFSSTRGGGSGIYLANADGTGEQRRIYRGKATAPDWGPMPF